jgi:hypothetical protein
LQDGAKSCAKPDRTKRVTLYRYVGPQSELWDMEKAHSVWGQDDKADDLAAVPVTGVGKVLPSWGSGMKKPKSSTPDLSAGFIVAIDIQGRRKCARLRGARS